MKQMIKKMLKENEETRQRQHIIKSFLEERIKEGDIDQPDGNKREVIVEMANKNIKEVELFIKYLKSL